MALWVSLLLVIPGLALAPTSVEATAISFNFAGFITGVQSAPPGIEPGSAVTGTYTFESSTPDALQSGLFLGSYDDALLGVQLFLGGRRVEFAASGNNRISVWNKDYSVPRGATDYYRVAGSAFAGLVDGNAVHGLLSLNINLISVDDSPFDSDSLPLLPVIVEEFQHSAYFRITVDIPLDSTTIVVGQMISITPEPTTGSLVSVGLVLLALHRSRRTA